VGSRRGLVGIGGFRPSPTVALFNEILDVLASRRDDLGEVDDRDPRLLPPSSSDIILTLPEGETLPVPRRLDVGEKVSDGLVVDLEVGDGDLDLGRVGLVLDHLEEVVHRPLDDPWIDAVRETFIVVLVLAVDGVGLSAAGGLEGEKARSRV
jgi:hypothetical protein